MHANPFTMLTEAADLADATDVRHTVSVESGYQPTLERDVVVRRLRAASDSRQRSRFLKEVRALALLRHHGFVHVYDAGVRDEVPFAVFERLRGVTAQHRLDLLTDQQSRMELDEAVRIVESVARAVAYARRQNVRVHDVSPGNIVLTEDSRVVLTGLGEPLPENPLIASTTALAYTAPERLFGAPAAGDADVYGLGVLLAQLVFGRLPFEGSQISIIAQKRQHQSLPVLSASDVALACPYPVAALMHRATASDPRDRLVSVEQFTEALLEVVSGRGQQSAAAPAVQPRSHRAPFEMPERTRPFASIYPFEAYAGQQAGRSVSESYAEPAVASLFVDEPVLHVQRAVEPGPVVEPRAVAAQVAPHATTLVEPLLPLEPARAKEPVAYDPLMPGLDKPALAAALPYTILVPMPQGAEEQAPTRIIPQQNVLRPHYVVVLMMLFVLAVGAAAIFG